MDLNTGKLYESIEQARAAGVSEADLVDARTGSPFKRDPWPEPTPNRPQGERERTRRLRQLAAADQQ